MSAAGMPLCSHATSLERWDAHGTNNYGLVPYVGLRQPLVKPLGEARSAQVILRDLARRIGGGMEVYFDFEDVEDFYREWSHRRRDADRSSAFDRRVKLVRQRMSDSQSLNEARAVALELAARLVVRRPDGRQRFAGC